MENHRSHWTKKQIAAYNRAVKRGDTLAYYCSDQFGRPANGGTKIEQCAPGVVHKETEAVICSRGLHATVDAPHAWKGCRVWVVACSGIAGREANKIVSTRREVIGEILPDECLDVRVLVRLGNLSGANLYGASLYGANLYGADLSVADLSGANLSGANLTRANLTRANLSGANLYGASLYGADLTRANLTRANLTRANLSGANLYGADGAQLSDKQKKEIAK